MPIIYSSYDADTGEEIIFFTGRRFVRKYAGETLAAGESLVTITTPKKTYQMVMVTKTVGMVRDYVTKRFLRGINGFTIWVALLFKYPPEEARHGNPLYVDCKVSSFVMADEVDNIEDIEEDLGWEAEKQIEDMFGQTVAELAEVVGSEHKIEVTSEVYPDYHWYIVWHHYKNDEDEKDGVDTIGKIRSP